MSRRSWGLVSNLISIFVFIGNGILTPPRSLAFWENAFGTGWKAIEPMTPATPSTDSLTSRK